MKKIGILTYHHIVNWGSVLQAYCLQQLLTKLFPRDDIEIIDYVPLTSHEYNKSRLYFKRRFFGLPYRTPQYDFFRKKRQCHSFLRKHCKLSSSKIITDDLLIGNEFLDKQNYDLIVVGSDTVFQLGPNFGGIYLGAPQAPNLYFLPFPISSRRIAFAVSANPFSSTLLDNLNLDGTRKALGMFEHIYYRDEVTRQALKLLHVAESALSFMPDPSLLVDFDLICRREPKGFNYENMAGVAIGNPGIANMVISAYIQMGYKAVNLLSGNSHGAAVGVENISSVEEFIALHRKFKLVVTDRFHGSIITLIVGSCPLIGIEEVERYPEPNSKLRDLYVRLEIDQMILRYNKQIINSDMISEMIEKWRWTKLSILQTLTAIRAKAFQELSTFNSLI